MLPPHITLHTPFKSIETITDEVLSDLTDMFAQIPRFSFVLGKTGRFPRAGVLYLAPEPSTPFVELSREIGGRYPEAPADFAAPIMHLTVAQGYTDEELTEVEREFHQEFGKRLPFQLTADDVCLYVKEDGIWTLHTTFEFSEAEEYIREGW